MSKLTAVVSFLVYAFIILAAIYYHPDLETYKSYVKEKCCVNDICPMYDRCRLELNYLSIRCGHNSVKHLSQVNFTELTKNCHYLHVESTF